MTGQKKTEFSFPPIPNKRYFTIGEVGQLCDVKSHVLRYWEQEFEPLKPIKRRGNRRYYQRHDIELIRLIRTLLYEQGFTIAGARQQLAALPRATSRESASALEAIREMRERISQSGGNLLALDPQGESGEATSSDERSEGTPSPTSPPAGRELDLREIRLGLESLADELSPYCRAAGEE
ncbi:MAG: MerR family transcriptional regulator [Pseudomonadota bacterium]